MKDYYTILGINKNATLSEIKTAYRKLAMKFHPDLNSGDIFFENMFRELKDAYETLSDPQKRAQYDAVIKSKVDANGPYHASTVQNEQEPEKLVKDIISNLRQIVNQLKEVPKVEINFKPISEYLDRILVGEIRNLYQLIPIKQKREFIFNAISLLKFFEQDQRNKYVIQLVIIAGTDNQLIEEIYEKLNTESLKQKEKDKIRFSVLKWMLAGIVAFISTIYFISGTYNNSKNSLPSETDIIKHKNEAKSKFYDNEFLRVKKTSKWKGNQLKTGDSPYNHHFGKGIYDKNYKNKIIIHNGHDRDVVVCLARSNSSGSEKVIRNEYIRAGESFEMTMIPNGTYYLKSFFGNDWNPDTLFMDEIRGFFENDISFSKSDDYSDLLRIEQNNDHYSVYEITLYPVVGGNMKSVLISADDFFDTLKSRRR